MSLKETILKITKKFKSPDNEASIVKGVPMSVLPLFKDYLKGKNCRIKYRGPSIPGINFLTSIGFKVIRMGKNQKKSFVISNKNYFDYSLSNLKSDLIDVWLMSRCNLCISTGTGLDQIARIFNNPILFVNHLPLSDWSSYAKSLTHPKYLYNRNTNKLLNLLEYIKFSFLKNTDYQKNNIKIVDLNKDEILKCFKEFIFLHKNNWIISKKDYKIQKEFQKTFKKGINIFQSHIDFHRYINKHSYISMNFLKKGEILNL